MKKLIGVLLLSTALMGHVNAADGDDTVIDKVATWVEEKLENPSATIKKSIDLLCLTADLAGTKASNTIDEDTFAGAMIQCIKLISKWIDLQKLEKHYLPYYLKERLMKEKWYQEMKREQFRHKAKAPKLHQLLLV